MEMQLKFTEVFAPKTLYENYIEDKLEHDFVIPDYLSSAQKIIQCEAKTVILDKNIHEDKIILEGLCIWKILYVSEEDQMLHSISCEKNFSEHFSVDMSGTLRFKVKTKNVLCKLQSSQRATCKATICIAVQINENENHSVLSDVSNESVQLRKNCVSVLSPIAEREFEFKSTGEIVLKHRREMQVHDANAEVIIKETRCLDRKIMIKGVCKNRVILISKEDCFAECLETETVFNQVFDVDGMTESSVAAVSIEAGECDTTINEEDGQRLLLVNTTCLAQISAFQTQAINFATDCYHTEKEVVSEKIGVPYYSKIVCNDLAVKCSRNIPMNAAGIDIFYNESQGEVEKISAQDDLLIIEGKVNVTFLYLLNREIVRSTYSLPFQATRRIDGTFARMKCDAQIVVEELGYLILSDTEIEINCECKIFLNAYLIDECNGIGQLSLSDQPVEKMMKTPLVLYYADAGEELWEIGKKYRVSMQTLLKSNQLQCEKLEKPSLIFISKR